MRDIVPEHLHKFYFGNIHENVLEYERSKYGHEDALYEGLILSHPLDKVLDVLDRRGYYVAEGDDNTFFVRVDGDVDLDTLFVDVNNMGYFPASSGSIKSNMHKFDLSAVESDIVKYKMTFIRFEAKYDVQLSLSDYKYLYHVTHKLYIDKIKRNGLIPKSASKLSNHPERVYLAFDKSDLNTFISHPKNFERPKKSTNEKPPPSVRRLFSVAVVLKIIVDRLPYNFRIYADPNFVGKACYTLNTIPWSAIVIEDEFELPQSKV